MKKNFIYILLIAITACNNSSTETTATDAQTPVEQTDIKNTIKEEQLATKKDPVCGMPAYKFLADTTMYQGGIYGFCGKGCKDEFLKTPENFITVADERTQGN